MPAVDVRRMFVSRWPGWLSRDAEAALVRRVRVHGQIVSPYPEMTIGPQHGDYRRGREFQGLGPASTSSKGKKSQAGLLRKDKVHGLL
jgi:hypothetical protein